MDSTESWYSEDKMTRRGLWSEAAGVPRGPGEMTGVPQVGGLGGRKATDRLPAGEDGLCQGGDRPGVWPPRLASR